MVELIALGIALLVGFYAGWKAHEHFMTVVIKYTPEIMEAACKAAREEMATGQVTIETDDGKTITADGTELAIEKVKGVLYAYTKSENKFIAQGETIEELLKSAHERFPGKTFFGDLPE